MALIQMAMSTASTGPSSIQPLLDSPGVVHHWPFTASDVPRWRQRQVLEAVLRRGIRFPRHHMVKAGDVRPDATWAMYFAYIPNGELLLKHRFTLRRLREQGFAVCVVVSTASKEIVASELATLADVILWKDLPGYDFSAYKVGLWALAEIAEGASVIVLNDSVAGPLVDLNPFVREAMWDLTGFSAAGIIENHIQSYAFVIRRLTKKFLVALRTVFFPYLACRERDDVILCQETRLARVASASMTVGSIWYSPERDLTQKMPFQLVDAGFPFFKRSLTADRSAFVDKERAISFIDDLERGR